MNSLAKLKLNKSSYYFLVIAPIIVKALEKVNNPFFMKVGGSDIQINLEPPFSWYLFYFGAVAIVIGSLLYQIFCPELIKTYRNYGEFLEAGEFDNYLDRVARKYDLPVFFSPFMEKPYLK